MKIFRLAGVLQLGESAVSRGPGIRYHDIYDLGLEKYGVRPSEALVATVVAIQPALIHAILRSVGFDFLGRSFNNQPSPARFDL
jgi:hypothetical protein